VKKQPGVVVVRVSIRTPKPPPVIREPSRRGLSFEREREGGRVSYYSVSFLKNKNKIKRANKERPREPGFVIENLRFFDSLAGF
jgi:hypothetical protein